MPRRRALTEAQLESLFALPTAEADLVRHWTLGRGDFTAIDRRRGAPKSLLSNLIARRPMRKASFDQMSVTIFGE